jgi:hypothetical protein
VLTADGKQVLVEASQARIAATRDPAKQAVADRHAAAREAAQAAGDGEVAALGSDLPPLAGDEAEGDLSVRRAKTRAAIEEEALFKIRRENAVAAGQLLSAADVEAAVADAATTLRNRLETLADVLAPQVASVPDEARCRAIIADQVEHLLAELARQFAGVIPRQVAA